MSGLILGIRLGGDLVSDLLAGVVDAVLHVIRGVVHLAFDMVEDALGLVLDFVPRVVHLSSRVVGGVLEVLAHVGLWWVGVDHEDGGRGLQYAERGTDDSVIGTSLLT